MNITPLGQRMLKKNPYVETVTESELILKTDFRIELFNLWKQTGRELSVKIRLDEKGLISKYITVYYPGILITSFKNRGYPAHTDGEIDENPSLDNNNPLIRSGNFYRKYGTGIISTPKFEDELFALYPEKSVEDGIKASGISLIDVGKNEITRLNVLFKSRIQNEVSEFRTYKSIYEEKNARQVPFPLSRTICNPYIANIDINIELKPEFYSEASFMAELPVEVIMETFELKTEWFDASETAMIKTKLLYYDGDIKNLDSYSKQYLRIQHKRIKAMMQLADSNFRRIKDLLKNSGMVSRQNCFRIIKGLPPDPMKIYSVKRILNDIGVTKSHFYNVINNGDYGANIQKRYKQDERDIGIIRKVIEYKGFEKGIRQIHMLMPKITGESMSVYRIRTLMNRFGVRTSVRQPRQSRKAMKNLIDRNKKANLLMRRFRLHRPNEVRLIDVTYLDYGDGLRAYGSASVDPVTGKLICFIISGSNDLKLALDTLEAMDKYPAKPGAILHSDQGMVYMTDDFQTAVSEKDFIQSMSRRGNCWDNSPQESFFGHFKDECHYGECENIKELTEKVSEYSIYYNTERGMWDRKKMTPDEYESYMENLSDADFEEYIREEETRYQEMKDAAAKKAIESARGYRDEAEIMRGEADNED